MPKRIQYVADDVVVLMLDGLQWVERTDRESLGFDKRRFWLAWHFKGVDHTAAYTDEKVRDEMFLKVRQALLSRNPGPGAEEVKPCT